MTFIDIQGGRQSELKSGGAERDFSRLRDLEARNLGYVRDQKTGGALAYFITILKFF